jgi:hypothetical protein
MHEFVELEYANLASWAADEERLPFFRCFDRRRPPEVIDFLALHAVVREPMSAFPSRTAYSAAASSSAGLKQCLISMSASF